MRLKAAIWAAVAMGLMLMAAPATWARPLYDVGGGPLAGAQSDAAADLHAYVTGMGLTMPTASYPLPDSELAVLKARASRHASGAGSTGDAGPLGIANDSPAAAVLSVDSELALEGYIGSPPDALGFQDRFQRVDPVIDLALGLMITNGPAVWVRAEWVAEYYRSHTLNFPDPEPGNPTGFENNNISGYVYLPLPWGSASIGRQSVHLGEPGVSSLMVSERLPYLDTIVLRVLMGRLTLTQIVATIENRRATPDINDGDNPDFKFEQNTILYSARYYEWWFGTLRLASGSQMVAARTYNAFSLADLFPAFSWHNADVGPHNLSVTFDASWQIVPSLGVFGAVGFDDVNLNFAGITDAGIPTVFGAIVAARWSPPGFPLSLTVETGTTHYLWGMFDDDQDLVRAIWRRFSDNVHQSMPLTSPYGPGAYWLSLDSIWSPLDALDLTVDANGVMWDPRADLFGGSFANVPLPAVEWSWMVRSSLGLRYDFPWGFSAHLSGGFEAQNTGTDWFLELGGAWGLHQAVDIPAP